MILEKPDQVEAGEGILQVNSVDIFEDLLSSHEAMENAQWGDAGYFVGLAGRQILGSEESTDQLVEIYSHWCGGHHWDSEPSQFVAEPTEFGPKN